MGAAATTIEPRYPLPAVVPFDAAKWEAKVFDLSKWGLSADDVAPAGLAQYDVPHWLIVPLLRCFRHGNTALDTLYYDVGVLWLRLFTRGYTLTSANADLPSIAFNNLAAMQAAARMINLSALANPEGAILTIDAHRAPFIQRYDDVEEFLGSGPAFSADNGDTTPIKIVSVTGVGSSALGSAAFAWNLSEALRQPVAAIVPGYGLADLIPQALGGWFGFGLHDAMRRAVQLMLAHTAPEAARIGRHLWRSIPRVAATDADTFLTGSPESDVLHHILLEAPQIERLCGHSKGALAIENAVRSLPETRYRNLHVTTFGCVVQEETDADYDQIMGEIDSLGQLNSWGNWPEQWIFSWHSTNTMLPLTMAVARLAKQEVN